MEGVDHDYRRDLAARAMQAIVGNPGYVDYILKEAAKAQAPLPSAVSKEAWSIADQMLNQERGEKKPSAIWERLKTVTEAEIWEAAKVLVVYKAAKCETLEQWEGVAKEYAKAALEAAAKVRGK